MQPTHEHLQVQLHELTFSPRRFHKIGLWPSEVSRLISVVLSLLVIGIEAFSASTNDDQDQKGHDKRLHLEDTRMRSDECGMSFLAAIVSSFGVLPAM